MRHESIMSLDRWLQLMKRWGFSDNEETFSSLVASYSEKGRHYHTQEHVTTCLRHLDRCVSDIDEPREVELTLWFHDAIYKPLSGDNEKESADPVNCNGSAWWCCLSG
jgi:predicted metal-dependent HD superfamily phosphohydrolase